MGIDVIGIAVLGLVFLIGTWRSINLGAISLVAAVGLGTGLAGVSLKEIYAGFPADLFVLLVGVTFLFGVATANGTVEWVVDRAAHLVGHRSRLLPWVLFLVAAIPTTAGALGPAAIAILAPLGLRVGQRYNINPVLTALMIVHGSAVGNFSPVNVLGAIVNQTMRREGLPSSPLVLFVGNLAFNVLLGVAIYIIYGRALRKSNGPRSDPLLPATDTTAATEAADVESPPSGTSTAVTTIPATATSTDAVGVTELDAPKLVPLTRPQVVTCIAVVIVLVGAMGFRLDIGVLALVAAVILRLITPASSEGAEKSIAWGVVLLIGGIVTYVALLQHIGTIERLGKAMADMRIPLLATLAICVIAGAVSAFASSLGVIGAMIPLSVPLIALGDVSAVGLVVAVSISATAVDATPFSTVGALTVANAPEDQRQRIYSGMLRWGLSMVIVAPVTAWLIFVLIPSLL